MVTPFLGQIVIYPYTFSPVGWLDCDGRSLNIIEYQELYSLLGTTYGGNGVSTFNLPDLRGRVPINQGSGSGTNYHIGTMFGNEQITLDFTNMPAHNHALMATTENGNTSDPTGAYSANTLIIDKEYKSAPTTKVNMSSIMVSPTGENIPEPISVVQPIIALRYCIAVDIGNAFYPVQG